MRESLPRSLGTKECGLGTAKLTEARDSVTNSVEKKTKKSKQI